MAVSLACSVTGLTCTEVNIWHGSQEASLIVCRAPNDNVPGDIILLFHVAVTAPYKEAFDNLF